MNEQKSSIVFLKALPQNPTAEQMADQIRHIQERAEFVIRNQGKEIAELKKRIEVLEG